MKNNYFSIGNRKIGRGQPTFIVAEISGNHNKSYDKALQIIDAAIDAGVDAIKLQTYTPDTLTINSDEKWFKVTEGPWEGKTLYELYESAYTPWEWQEKLKEHVEARGVLFFSTPFDETAVDFLEDLGTQFYKVASFELTDVVLLKKIAQTKKPVIISRGMASMTEIKLAIKTLYKYGAPQVAVLHCVSAYPASPEDMNLATISDLAKKFKVVSGLSDHTLGNTTSIAAVALGASIIEKHVTFSRLEGGPDSAFSLEPQELKNLVRAIRETELSIGEPKYSISEKEGKSRIFRRSLFVVKDIKKGEKFDKVNLRSIRPGFGMAIKNFDAILGKVASRDIKAGTPMSWELIK
jgi:pseudaminic acid synthase